MLKFDQEEIIESLKVHHGQLNDRIYVLDHSDSSTDKTIASVQEILEKYNYGKVILVVKEQDRSMYIEQGYSEEARIPGYFKGLADGVFMVKYNKEDRKHVRDKIKIEGVLEKLKSLPDKELKNLAYDYRIKELKEDDANAMASLYRKVFSSYPFPIHEADYLKETMEGSFMYFGIFHGNALVAISSCDLNREKSNVEMTDFAVLPDYRGRQLSRILLSHMDTVMAVEGIKTAYTIARSISLPMNGTFKRGDYHYGGTLWNNTQIAGKIESMNIWYKKLLVSKNR